MIPIVARAEASAHEARRWDVTPIVARAVADASSTGLPLVALWLTAESCPGCLMLKAQVVGDSSDRLYGSARVVQLEVGDVAHSIVRRIIVGDRAFLVPGVPAMLLLARTGDRELQLHSVSLGPLAAVDAHGDIKKLVEGVSRWVPEAAAARVTVEGQDGKLQLDAANRFLAPVKIAI